MRTVNVALEKGLTIGEAEYRDAVVRESSVGDILDATEESERLRNTPSGYQLLASPTLTAMHLLRRQIMRIGEYQGPLTLGELRKLSSTDIGLLQGAAQAIDAASAREAEERGRDDSPPE